MENADLLHLLGKKVEITRKEKGVCGICPYNCDVLITLEDGRISSVLPDLEGPNGNLCPMGKAADQIVYSEQRVLHPLIRNGRKGTASFREGTWEEALGMIADSFGQIIDRYGPKGMASYMGGGSLEDSLRDIYPAYFNKIGSPNDMSSGSICFVASRILAPVMTSGLYGRAISADIDHSEVIFVWGINPKTNSGTGKYKQLLKAKKRGARIITVDPRGNEMADMADLWVPVKPGADGALALAMLKLLIENNQYDKQFVSEYTFGFADLKDYLEAADLGYLTECCGVDIELIKEITRIFCSTEKVSVIFYTGLEYQPSGVQNTRALYCLWALGGKLDVRGGLYIDKYPGEVVKEYIFDPENIPVGAKEYPLFSAVTGRGQFVEFPKAVLDDDPYPVRGLLLLGASPIVSYPHQELWQSVYEHLDCLVVIDRFMTEEAKWADVILPAATYYEYTSYCYYTDGIRLREKIIEPVSEARNDIFILQAIADKMGFGHYFPKNDEELLKTAFQNNDTLKVMKESPYGIKTEKKEERYRKYETGHLRKDGQKGFPTPTGKFEIRSTLLEKYGYDGLPVYKDPFDLVSEKNIFPFVLTTGARSPFRYNSFGPNIKNLALKDRAAALEISFEDAKSLGLSDNEMVKVETPFAQMILPVRFCNIKAGVVHVPSGGGSSFQSAGWSKINPNEICGYGYRDNVSGFIVCKAVPCRISKQKNQK